MNTLTAITQSLADLTPSEHPPVHLWQPKYSGSIDIVIKSNGEWLHEGGIIKRDSLVKLLASVLWLEQDQYFLKTPQEKLAITVEDTPFLATLMDCVIDHNKQQHLVFTTHYGDVVVADRQHPIVVETDPSNGHPLPSVIIRYGMKARLSRSIFYQIADLGEVVDDTNSPTGQRMHIASKGVHFDLGEC